MENIMSITISPDRSKLTLAFFLLIALSLNMGQRVMADVNELKVLTWNIFLLPNNLAHKIDEGVYRTQRTLGIINEINSSGADVVVLTEMFHNNDSETIMDNVADSFPYQTNVLGRYGGLGDGGVVILSRFPIEVDAETIFSSGVGNDWWANKGVMYAKINKSIGEASNFFHVFATHTQAEIANRWYNPRNQDIKSRDARRSQFTEISEFIEEQNIPSTELVVITGDMNVDFYNSTEYDIMLQRLNADTSDLRGLGSDIKPVTYSTSQNSFIEEEDGLYEELLDYALYSRLHRIPALATSRIQKFGHPIGGDLSDHYALLSTFHLENNRTCRDFATSFNTRTGKRPHSSTHKLPQNLILTDENFILTGNEIRLLCGTAKRVKGPARCYKNIVEGNIASDNEPPWNKAQAISFCSSNIFTQSRLNCFGKKIAQKKSREIARTLCNPSRTQVWSN